MRHPDRACKAQKVRSEAALMSCRYSRPTVTVVLYFLPVDVDRGAIEQYVYGTFGTADDLTFYETDDGVFTGVAAFDCDAQEASLVLDDVERRSRRRVRIKILGGADANCT